MKKIFVTTFVFVVLLLCSCCHSVEKGAITAEMAYEGVNNYCHSVYDWSKAETDSVTMYLSMGDETPTEYQVVFRSYTGAKVYFHVDKNSGTTRIVEHAPVIDVEEETGTINLYDYLKKDK